MSKEVRSLVAFSDVFVPEDFNSRKTMGALDELAYSLDQQGLIQPLVVREGGPSKKDPNKRGFFLVAGERRYRAIELLRNADYVPVIDGKKMPRKTSPSSWNQVEVKLIKGDLERQITVNLLENAQREDVPPIEQAQSMKHAMDTLGWSQSELAKRMGKSEPWVSQRLKLLKQATPELQKAVQTGKLKSTHGREIASLPAAHQKDVLDHIEEKEKKTGKKVTAAEVKDEVDRRKTAIKRKDNPDYDKERVKAAREAYEGIEMSIKPKQALLEQLAVFMEKAERAKSSESKQVIKGQIAVVEWVLGVRDSIG